jgi:hypothetical protein
MKICKNSQVARTETELQTEEVSLTVVRPSDQLADKRCSKISSMVMVQEKHQK